MFPDDVLAYLRARFASRNHTTGLPTNNRNETVAVFGQFPTSEDLQAARDEGYVIAGLIPERDLVNYLIERGHDYTGITQALARAGLIRWCRIEGSNAGRVDVRRVINPTELGQLPYALAQQTRLIAVCESVMTYRNEPERSVNATPALTERERDILAAMLRNRWITPERATNQDRIARAVEPGLTGRSLARPFSELRTRGLIASTGQGCRAGTYLTPEGVEAARDLEQ